MLGRRSKLFKEREDRRMAWRPWSINRAARAHYFSKFDFSGLRLDVAFRKLCDKLFLRAETQQIDRILAAFSQRYYECNTDTVFGSADVIHSVVFSILLLNTDLHIAELQERMTRQQFVRNTLSAIAESSPDGPVQDDSRSSFSVTPNDFSSSTDAVSPAFNPAQRRNSISSYLGGRSKQTSSVSNLDVSSDAMHQEGPRPGTAMSGAKTKEAEIEVMLKDIYAAVKNERILLPSPEAGCRSLVRLWSDGWWTQEDGKSNDRMMALKRGSIRGIQGLLGGLGPDSPSDPLVSPNLSRSSVDSWGRPSQSLSMEEIVIERCCHPLHLSRLALPVPCRKPSSRSLRKKRQQQAVSANRPQRSSLPWPMKRMTMISLHLPVHLGQKKAL